MVSTHEAHSFRFRFQFRLPLILNPWSLSFRFSFIIYRFLALNFYLQIKIFSFP